MPKHPNTNTRCPVPGENGQDPYDVTYIKPTITRPNIIVGDFNYYSGLDFKSRVTHHYEFYAEKSSPLVLQATFLSPKRTSGARRRRR